MQRALAVLVMVAAAFGAAALDQERPARAMAQAAARFLATLDEAQRAQVRFAFDDEERFNWHFIPRERKGLPLKAMTPPQRDAAFALLRTGLSTSGMTRAETIRSLENVLRAMENRAVRDPELYFFTIFGDPATETWGWRYEGHHLAQNWTIAGGRVVAASPAFLGANPAEVMEGPAKGTRALAAEGDLAWALLRSLTDDQRREVVIGPTAPNDIVTGNARKAAIEGNRGLRAGAMSADQRRMLRALIDAHASVQTAELAQARLASVDVGGFDEVRFAWMGATEQAPGAAHYYRIQGRAFLVEYDNTQNRANHQHIVWRNFQGDFGLDALGRHYEAVPHGR